MNSIADIVTSSGTPEGSSVVQRFHDVKEREINIIATNMLGDVTSLYLANNYYIIVPYRTNSTYPNEMPRVSRQEKGDVILPLSSLELLALLRSKKHTS